MVRKLRDLIPSEFPDAVISIIRGYDNFSYEAYTQGAFFGKERAEKAMNEIPSNGGPDLSNTYHIITGTVEDLNKDRMFDKKTNMPLDNHDKKMIYEHLKKDLQESLA